jgi:hypothetical protein
MYHAPAVEYPAGRSRAQAALSAGVAVVGLVLNGAWWALQPGQAMLACVGMLLASSVAIRAWARWRRPVLASLAWTGSQWQWAQQGRVQAAAVQVVWDLQGALLVQVCALSAGRCWSVWLERQTRPALWHALRCALYAPVSPAAADGPAGLGLHRG